MDDIKGKLVYTIVAALCVGFTLRPFFMKSADYGRKAAIGVMLIGLFGILWCVLGILTDTARFASRFSASQARVLWAARHFSAGVATGAALALAVTGQFRFSRRPNSPIGK